MSPVLIQRSTILSVLIFSFVCVIYYYWGWSDVLGGLGGDNAYYALTAEYFSPWGSRSAASDFFSSRSQYPPLYPIVLAAFYGGESLLFAHIVTITCLLLALFALYIWTRTFKLTSTISVLVPLLVAVLPITYMLALELLSEHLYLLLTIICLSAITQYEENNRLNWLWFAVGALVASTLTRSVGISLLVAFLIYILVHRPPNYWRFAVVSLVPMMIWNIFNGKESQGYFVSFIGKYNFNSASELLLSFLDGFKVIWYGWFSNFSGSNIAAVVSGFLGIVCLLGLGVRIYQRKLDGYYAAAYLALILIWPYPAEIQRLMFVIMPILILQGMLLLEILPSVRILSFNLKAAYLLIAAVFLIATPQLVLTVKRFMTPMPQELSEYRRTADWYAISPLEAHVNLSAIKSLEEHLKSLRAVVPENECIYSIKPSIVGYFSGRDSVIPPRPHFNQKDFDDYLDKTRCRYFYFMNFSSPSFGEPNYPLSRMHENVRIISVAPVGQVVGTFVGMLAEFIRH